MPFSRTPDGRDEGYWEGFFEEYLKPALKACGFKAYKSVGTPNNITKHIIRELAMSDLVVAVLTGDKPNAFYELGVRHSLRQGTIMILEGERPPFDISNYGVLFYKDKDRNQDREKFTGDLKQQIDALKMRHEDSPVADFLNQRITVSVNLALGRLRQSVEILNASKERSYGDALRELKALQAEWDARIEQVSVLIDGKFELHAQEVTLGQRGDEQWMDQTVSPPRSLYPMMKERRWGFRIVQLEHWQNRVTALAFEEVKSVDPHCMVVAEAHYFQEERPY